MDWVLPLVTLTLMEVVLGIDNVIFLSILVGPLPADKQPLARRLGLGLALAARLGLLLGIKWVMGLTTPIFHWSWLGFVPEVWIEHHHVDAVTGRDLVLLVGGLFLIGKSVVEMHKRMAGDEEDEVRSKSKGASLGSVIVQIVILDLVFSLDSVISAIGMVQDVWIMVVAMVIAVVVMAIFAERISRFIEKNPTFKMLALSFLVLIGVVLIADGIGTHIGKGYIYASMAFALIVELLNMRARRPKKKVSA